ncbi:ribosome biogenesis GTPase Der [Rhodothalassium salexigens]|uniref:ribosome biogenesis GTPase Der n=1 Tax=Rhodothalassium salexigens TaxID=1086 RepID=UPI0019144B02|nr:ribosome biogenesis GTPase Der [Rhodothalassium salexigens]MBK5911609.1 ribosome biogenesis GTPase Der [Rhodothalassium salexigens]MBK5920902.1 ribosome biogenesis GTPase Der [Rhodothalassium salexigens]
MTETASPPLIAIVGRPNVGKSTLFNRLVGRRLALVDDTPGVTRDRREGEGRLADLRFRLVDTAGLEQGGPGSLAKRMHDQTAAAVDQADLALMMIDARAGVTPADEHFAAWLREKSTPTVLLANKCEGAAADSGVYEAYALGLGEPIAVSAEHAGGMGELYDAIRQALGDAALIPEDDGLGADDEDDDGEPEEGDLDFEFDDSEGEAERARPLRLAIVGRPNAGKSTLINHLVGEDRLITGPEAGLTRDAIAVPWAWDDRPIMLWDTAGLRRRSRVQEKLEALSVADTRRAIQFAEVVVLLIDATLGVEKQDLKIMRDVVDEGRALVVALSKWDLVEDRLAVQRQLSDALQRSMPQARGVATITLSGLTGQGVAKMMPATFETYDDWNARIPTGEFNRWLAAAVDTNPPPAPGGRRIKLRYGAQIKSRPPTFVLFCNKPEDLPASYMRYLENELRRDFDLPGVPIRLYLRKGENPYATGRRTARQRKANKRRG